MTLKNYTPTEGSFWTGRVDDTTDRDSFRMHQVMERIDLTQLDATKVDASACNICFIGFCCDEGIARNLGRTGAKGGPDYIRRDFANLPVTFTSRTTLYDAGNIWCEDDKMEEAQEQLAIAIEGLLDHHLFPIVLGGGHELALGHYNGIDRHARKQASPRPSVGIINFDAHFDLRPYPNGGSSGTMFAQIADRCAVEKREFGYLCLGIQTSSNTVSLFKRAELLGASHVLAKDFIEPNFTSISSQIASFADRHEHLYVTICSDVFNAASAPGVSALQPFGMNPEVVLLFLKEILATNRVVSLDIAEVSPRFDQDKRTAKLAAVILYAIVNTLTETWQKANG